MKQLKAALFIPNTRHEHMYSAQESDSPSGKQKSHTIWSESTELCVTLLVVTELLDEVLNRNGFAVCRFISFCYQPDERLILVDEYKRTLPYLAKFTRIMASALSPAIAATMCLSIRQSFSGVLPFSKSLCRSR